MDKKMKIIVIVVVSIIALLVGVWGILYITTGSLETLAAENLAKSESLRLSKQLDDAVGAKGISNQMTIHLKPVLKVGNEEVPYKLEISDTGDVTIEFTEYPYEGIKGVSNFGLYLEGTSQTLDCTPEQIAEGASIRVEKEASYRYDSSQQKVYYEVKVSLDASQDCGEMVILQQSFEET